MRKAPAVFLNLILPPLGFILLENRNRFFLFASISILVSLLSPLVLLLLSAAPHLHLTWIILITIGLRLLVLIVTLFTHPAESHPRLAKPFAWVLVSVFLLLDVAACSFQRHTAPGLFLNGVGVEASLSRGDFLYILRNSESHTLQRGDIIAYEDRETRQVSRVIGLPGETIRVEQKLLNANERPYWVSEVRINGVPLPLEVTSRNLKDLNLDLPESRDFLVLEQTIGNRRFPILETPELMQSNVPEIRLEADQYFVMGDNRDNSQDSRTLGYIRRSRILFRYIYTAASFNFRKGYCEDRIEGKTLKPTPEDCLDADPRLNRKAWDNIVLEWKRAIPRWERWLKISP
ncbi:MAG: signal peptidase I [Leptospirales bacterium]|nr:signal peptidase I [Leptospirales bacterium]